MRILAVLALLCAVIGCKAKTKAPAAAPDAGKPVVAVVDAAAPRPAGDRWGGAILVPDQAPLEFEVIFAPTTPPTATIAIPAQKLTATALVAVTYSATAMTFTLENAASAEAHARFEVTRAADGQSARGTLHQHGAVMKVQMRPLADGEHVGDGTRPQTPKPPFPYTARDAIYPSKDGTTLAGTLTVPPGAGKHPAVVLITGTGAQDRNETLSGHQPFLILADHLSRAGIAVLRVDDRGVGGSGGDTGTAGIDDKVEDARAGVAWLATQPEIDPARIGLIGHSEGGGIAPLAATRDGVAIAFVVLLAGPGVSGAELAVVQNALQVRVMGASEELIAAQSASLRKLLAVQVDGGDADALRAAATAHIDLMGTLVPEADRARFTGASRQAMIDASVAGLSSKASRSFSQLDPTVALERLRCPVLALGGSLDLTVPSEDNLAKIRAALERGKHPDATVEELPGLNHLFQPAKKGLMAEYALIDVTFDPGALDKVSAWVRSHAGL